MNLIVVMKIMQMCWVFMENNMDTIPCVLRARVVQEGATSTGVTPKHVRCILMSMTSGRNVPKTLKRSQSASIGKMHPGERPLLAPD